MTANEAQIEYWNGAVGERWAKLQETLDAGLAPITAALMPFVNARPRERVLDIGCGCGTTTFLLAKAVGPEGNVTGVDISEPMLAVARARGRGVNFRKADAATHLFHPTHDLVFSRIGVMFFDDPPSAFANIRKALKPRGRLAFVCWRDVGENLWASAPFAAARALLPQAAGARPARAWPLRLRRWRAAAGDPGKGGLSRSRYREAGFRHAHGRHACRCGEAGAQHRPARPCGCGTSRRACGRGSKAWSRRTREIRPPPTASRRRPPAGWCARTI